MTSTPSPAAHKKREEMTGIYALHVPNPFDTPRHFYDKDGALCIMSMGQYLSECSKPKNRFTPTTLEAVLPAACYVLAVTLLFYIFAQAISPTP